MASLVVDPLAVVVGPLAVPVGTCYHVLTCYLGRRSSRRRTSGPKTTAACWRGRSRTHTVHSQSIASFHSSSGHSGRSRRWIPRPETSVWILTHPCSAAQHEGARVLRNLAFSILICLWMFSHPFAPRVRFSTRLRFIAEQCAYDVFSMSSGWHGALCNCAVCAQNAPSDPNSCRCPCSRESLPLVDLPLLFLLGRQSVMQTS